MSTTILRTTTTPSRGRRAARLSAGIGLFALVPFLIAAANTAQAATAPNLGTAASFSVLAGSGVTNTGVTTMDGSLGSYETPTVATDTPFVFNGSATNHAGDAVTQGAKANLLTAYNLVAGAPSSAAVPADLYREDPYLPGVYSAETSMALSGTITLDGAGSNDSVFIFKSPSTLITSSNAAVILTNGAQACNVYWQVGSSATFGTGTHLVGNVLAYTSITATTGATFEGRLLANFGAVTLDSNTITNPGCATGPSGGVDADGTATNATDATDAGTDADATDATDATNAGTDVAAVQSTDATDAGTDVTAVESTNAGTDVTAVESTDAGTDVTAIESTDATDATDAGTDISAIESTNATDAGTDISALEATEATDTGTDVSGLEAGTDTQATQVGTDITALDVGTDTNALDSTSAGFDTDSVNTQTDTEAVGTSAETVDSASTEAALDSSTDVEAATAADTTTGLPDTGGSDPLTLLLGMATVVAGLVLIVTSAPSRR
ncbi:hypothetical protein ASE12_03845 [Aeromicrobium sp. Root236]|uniref:ice-binding family protein n=1 Tax=Aeromicrobium sp. Root236 TaxID=1736498 RepID=UPI0007013450|nr:ice-binding family protein [Aeromicrobium sp. Root236]KRC63970.1 hypothetical protein ASE12_03845 [Aeromicrobium sp. Root236]